MLYFDISPLISEELAVFPGDKPFKRQVQFHINEDHLELSSILTTLHIGAHADAPIHYHKTGACIHERNLDYYIGSCQVITIETDKARITPDLIKSHTISAPRILFKTLSIKNPDIWQDDFTALSPELINYLATKNVRLVGIDTPSVDPADSKLLESHQAIFSHDMAILEGLVLTEVPDGLYELIALPLKIKDGDASPVRAILRIK